MIELRGLSVGYGRRAVASGLTASAPRGELVCLLGPNGAGKSTLLRTVCGFLAPLAGSVTLDGETPAGMGAATLSRRVAVVLTERVSARGLTARDVASAGRSPYTGFFGTQGRRDRELVDEALRLAGAWELAGRRLDTLSDGERQKVMVAKALAQCTPAIALDEPTAFLDFPSKVDTMRRLRLLARERGKAVLLSTHDVELALRLADRLWLMGGGRLVEGTPEALSASGDVERFLCAEGVSYDPGRRAFLIKSATS